MVCERMWDADCLLQISVIGSAFGSIVMAIAVEGKCAGKRSTIEGSTRGIQIGEEWSVCRRAFSRRVCSVIHEVEGDGMGEENRKFPPIMDRPLNFDK